MRWGVTGCWEGVVVVEAKMVGSSPRSRWGPLLSSSSLLLAWSSLSLGLGESSLPNVPDLPFLVACACLPFVGQTSARFQPAHSSLLNAFACFLPTRLASYLSGHPCDYLCILHSGRQLEVTFNFILTLAHAVLTRFRLVASFRRLRSCVL